MRGGDGDVPGTRQRRGCRSPTLRSPPSLDFSYQEEAESSGSELEAVVTPGPPRSESQAR